MSDPQTKEQQVETRALTPHRDGAATAPEYRPNAGEALAKIHERIKGHGDPNEVPQLISMLKDTDRAALAPDFLKFSTLPGDVILRCAAELPVVSPLAIKAALGGSEKPSRSALTGYLETSGKLGKLDAQTITTLRAMLPGSPLLLFRTLITNLGEAEANPAMLKWVIEESPPDLCAHAIGQTLSVGMVATLDAEQLWTRWIDHLRPTDVDVYSTSAIPRIQDPHARAKFTAAASGRAGMDMNQNVDDRAKPENERALDRALDDKQATVQSVLTAAGQAMRVNPKMFTRLVATLDRLHASADDVLSLSQVSNISIEPMLELLLRSSGVTATHVQIFLAEHGGFELLKKDKPRIAVQRMAGIPSLVQLIGPTHNAGVHDLIVSTPELFTWYMRGDVAPEDLLWLCGSNPKLAARACRLVEAQVGFGWTHRLMTLEPGNDGLLRTFALYCHDEPTASYVRQHLLGDPAWEDKTATKGSQPTDPATHSGQGGRFVDSLSEYGSPKQVVDRLGDLDEAVRFGLGRDDAALATIAKDLTGDYYARAARLMDLTFERTIRHSPAPSSATLAYLAARPHAEEVAALRSADLEIVARTIHSNLLLVFPSLTDPKVLAGMIGRGPLLELLLAGSDPGRVAALIGAEPVRAAAQPVLDQHPELLARLPHYKELAPQAQKGIDALAKHADPDVDVRESLDHDAKQPGVERQAKRLRDARKDMTLFEAIETLGAQHAKGDRQIDDKHDLYASVEHQHEQHVSETNALAILEQHRSEVPELLNAPAHRASALKLAALLDLPPNLAIPWIDGAALARMPNAIAWWMMFRDPLALLHQVANNPPAIAAVASAINANAAEAMHWLGILPKGFELDSLEDRVIEQLRAQLRTNIAGLHALFVVRFGMPAPADYDIVHTNELWDVIGRLPPQHLKQERISKFDTVPKEDMPDAAGQYSPGDQRIDIASNVEKGKEKDEFYSAGHEAWYERAGLQKAFGYDDAAFDQLLGQGRFDMRVALVGAVPTTQYRMKEQKIDLFTQVVLHEVGHSVDDMLGSRTPPVWDFAGWHEYSNANFDQWAAEMGGWDEVAAADKKSIREAWISAMGGKVAVKSLVDAEHPAVNTAKYTKVGIVTLGAAGKKLHYSERSQIGDRIFIAGTVEDSWFSVKASAAAVAPSDYSLNAPAEYFAESYVEYYRGADGTPGSEARKGGALASPVKQWFDAHVDKLKYDPKRFKGGATEQMKAAGEQPMQANNAPAKAGPSAKV